MRFFYARARVCASRPIALVPQGVWVSDGHR